MRHNPNGFAGFAVFEVDHDGVLAGFAAEEVDGVEVTVSACIVGGDDHVGGVVDADDGLALVVAQVEAVDVVSAENDRLGVEGRSLSFDRFVKAHHKFFEVDGTFACTGGTLLDTLFAVGLNHGQGCQEEYYGNNRIKDLYLI